jgi:glutaredoxin
MVSYWFLGAGVAIVLLFVVIAQLPSNRLHPRWNGFVESFASGSTPTFTMFGVDWCPHCVSAKPLFESLGSTVTIGDQNVALRYVNPEKDTAAAAGYAIEGFPTFYLEHHGKKLKYSGPRTADGFREFLQHNLS